MAKPISADGRAQDVTRADPAIEQENLTGRAGEDQFRQVDATVFVADVAGFSALMSSWIEKDSRAGAERAGTLIDLLFSRLSETLARRAVHMGGFAGDAITFWQEAGPQPLSLEEFRSFVEEAVRQSGEPFVLKVGADYGTVWAGHLPDGRLRIPVLWGEPITSAFDGLSMKTAETVPSAEGTNPALDGKSVAASVFNRWTFFIQLLSAEEISSVSPELISRAWRICDSIVRHYGGDCENLRQDDKGLAISAGLPDPEGSRQAVADECAGELKRALTELGLEVRIASAHGLVFRSQYEFGGARFAAIQGTSVNAAAKSLVKALSDPGVAAFTPGELADREGEVLPQGRPPSVMVGREEERTRIKRIIASGFQAQGNSFVYLHGEAGTGKTTLLDDVLENGLPQSAAVWRCRLRPSDAWVPFSALQKLLDGKGEAVAPMTTRADWLQHFQGFAGGSQTLLVIDDWQWCDPESRNILLALVRGRAFPAYLFSSRTPPDFEEDVPVEALSLEGLSDAATQSLLQKALGISLSAEELQSVRLIARGNPFWILEFGAMLKANRNAGLRLKDMEQREWSPEMLLRIRANDLTTEARALWRFFCAWQSRITLAAARFTLEKLRVVPTEEHLKELLSLGWLAPSNKRGEVVYAPAHQVLADWGCSDIPPTFETSLNTLIARTLTRQQADTARVARHWQVAGSTGRASVCYEKAAVSAFELGAHSLSLDLIQLAENLHGADPDSVSVRKRRRNALVISSEWGIGNMIAARRVLRDYEAPEVKGAAQTATPSEIQVEFVRAEIGQFSGNLPMIITGLRRGTMEGDGQYGKAVARARRAGFVYYILGLLGLPVGPRFTALIREAREENIPRSECMYLNAYSALLLGKGQWPRAAALLNRTRELIRDMTDVQVVGTTLTLDAHLHLYQGRGAEGAAVFRQLREEIARQPHRMMASWAVYGEAQGHVQAGDFDRALPMLERAQKMNIGTGDHQSTVIIAGLLARLALMRQAEQEALMQARKALRICRRLSKSNFTSIEGFAAPAYVAAHLAVRHGPSGELREMYREGRQHLAGYARGFPLAKPRLLMTEGLWHQAAGKPDRARATLRRAVDAAERINMGYEKALAASILHELR